MEEKLKLIEERIEPYLLELDLELADIEYVREGGYNFLRVYVENLKNETTLDDCVALSTKIDPIIDTMIEDKFYLEVSTPGLERKLKKEKDFLRFLGREIKIKTKSNVNNKKKFEGKLKEFKENTVYVQDDTDDEIVEISLDKIKEARLSFVLSDMTFREDVEGDGI
jgi:ribosome maturation factor rimP